MLVEEKSSYVDVDLGGGFVALMRELKLSLYSVARQAELANKDSFQAIQSQAEQSMRLIDSYIVSAQAEYGQARLDFAPLSLGSVMQETANELRGTLDCREVLIQAQARGPVMTHRATLHNLLEASCQAMAEVSSQDSGDLILRSYETKNGDIGAGVFSNSTNITPEDLRIALSLGGTARMPLARHSVRSGVMLIIADGLAKALGGSLEVKRMGRLRGLATLLPKSEQLSLI